MGIRIVAMSLMELLSGSVLPLPFLPDKLRAVLELLPFASMQNVPLRIYAGQIAGRERAFTMALQAVWLVLLAAAGKALMNRGPAPRRGAGRLNTEKGGFGHAAVSKIFFHPSAIGDAV